MKLISTRYKTWYNVIHKNLAPVFFQDKRHFKLVTYWTPTIHLKASTKKCISNKKKTNVTSKSTTVFRRRSAPDMVGEMLLSRKRLRAVRTPVRWLAGVLAHVVREVFFARERLGAERTLVRGLARVLSDVVDWKRIISFFYLVLQMGCLTFLTRESK